MSPHVRDALESAIDSSSAWSGLSAPRRRYSAASAVALIYAFAQELPSEMTVSDLCDELCNSANQGGL